MLEAEGSNVQRARGKREHVHSGRYQCWTGGAVGQEPRLEMQVGTRLIGS